MLFFTSLPSPCSLILLKIISMSSSGYKIRNKSAVHFITFAVVDWIDVFTRPVYQNIIVDSLERCQKKRGLILNGWCLMTNHLHLVGSAQKNDLSSILKDFKSYTAKSVIRAIHENPYESRKKWMVQKFGEHGQMNSRNQNVQFWQQDNQPKECFSLPFAMQKINYMHQNPVVAGLVSQAEDYRLSSATNYLMGKYFGLLEIDVDLTNLSPSFSNF